MEDIAETDRSRPLTFGDLADLTMDLAGIHDRQRTTLDDGLRRIRSELRDDLAHAGRLLRSDLAQTRHDLSARIDAVADQVDVLLATSRGRGAEVLLAAQLLVWALALAWLALR